MQQTVMRAFKFALDPSTEQSDAFSRHAGAARWAFNHALGAKMAARQDWLQQVHTLVGQGVPDAIARKQVKVPVPRKPVIQKALNALKGDSRTDEFPEGFHGPHRPCPWWHEVSTYAFQSAFEDADTAWKNWLESLAGRRAGRRVGFPRFKKKGRARDSFRLHHDVKKPTIRLDGYRRLLLPRIGSVRMHDTGKRLARLIERGHAVVQSVTVSRAGGRWYASVLTAVRQDLPDRPTRRQQQAGTIGVALGAGRGTDLVASLSGPISLDGLPVTAVPNPAYLAADTARVVKAQRALSRTQKGSQRRRRAVRRLADIHHRIAERRSTYLHTLTERLATGYAQVSLEALDVLAMTASARGTRKAPGRGVKRKAEENRKILDMAPGTVRRLLEYKTRWYGSRLALCEPGFAASVTCSACGWQNPRLTPTEPVFMCDSCDLVSDRGLNSARNIAAHATPVPDDGTVASRTGETLNARGAAVRPPAPRGRRRAAVKREGSPPGESPRGSDPPVIPHSQ